MATKQIVSGEMEIVVQHHMGPRRTRSILVYEVAFLGAGKGVALCRKGAGRAHNDPVIAVLLTEDNGDWYTTSDSCANAFWLPDMIEQMQAAHSWLKDYAEKVQFGWIFK
jgi:hypothetical protein